jgi:hypothetical protein
VRFLQTLEIFSSEASSWPSCCESHRHGRTFGTEPFLTIIVLHHNTQESERTHNGAAKTAGAQSNVIVEETGNEMISNRHTSRAAFDLQSSCCYPMQPDICSNKYTLFLLAGATQHACFYEGTPFLLLFHSTLNSCQALNLYELLDPSPSVYVNIRQRLFRRQGAWIREPAATRCPSR